MSLTIGIRFLTGYCVAARSRTDRLPEWPPHPARVFMALAAAHFECFDASAETAAALRWLEERDPPEICFDDKSPHNPATMTYVPTNDRDSIKSGVIIQTLPALRRHPAERQFPRTPVAEPLDRVYLVWPDESAGAHRDALDRLCGAVSRVGHSTSLVQMSLSDDPPPDEGLVTWRVDDARRVDDAWRVDDARRAASLRVPVKGTLNRLERSFQTPPHRPSFAPSRSYAPKAQAPSDVGITQFDPFLNVLQLVPDGSEFRWLQLETTLSLASTLRQAIQRRCPLQPPPQSISGHQPDGAPSDQPHMAILPLAHVGGEWGDGHLLGVGIAAPRGMGRDDAIALGRAIEEIADDGETRGAGLRFDARRFPGLGGWRLVRMDVLGPRRTNLDGDTWTAGAEGARVWATVTPIVLDHHAKAKSRGDYFDECAELVKAAIGRVVAGGGNVLVRITPVSPLGGVPDAGSFPRLARKDGSERRHYHAIVEFERPVVGPLLVGAGRYRGYGLLRPLPQKEAR